LTGLSNSDKQEYERIRDERRIFPEGLDSLTSAIADYSKRSDVPEHKAGRQRRQHPRQMKMFCEQERTIRGHRCEGDFNEVIFAMPSEKKRATSDERAAYETTAHCNEQPGQHLDGRARVSHGEFNTNDKQDSRRPVVQKALAFDHRKRPSALASLNAAITETGSVAAIRTPKTTAADHGQFDM
jgi:hypothetical protein